MLSPGAKVFSKAYGNFFAEMRHRKFPASSGISPGGQASIHASFRNTEPGRSFDGSEEPNLRSNLHSEVALDMYRHHALPPDERNEHLLMFQRVHNLKNCIPNEATSQSKENQISKKQRRRVKSEGKDDYASRGEQGGSNSYSPLSGQPHWQDEEKYSATTLTPKNLQAMVTRQRSPSIVDHVEDIEECSSTFAETGIISPEEEEQKLAKQRQQYGEVVEILMWDELRSQEQHFRNAIINHVACNDEVEVDDAQLDEWEGWVIEETGRRGTHELKIKEKLIELGVVGPGGEMYPKQLDRVLQRLMAHKNCQIEGTPSLSWRTTIQQLVAARPDSSQQPSMIDRQRTDRYVH
jgi:hypothetical protein